MDDWYEKCEGVVNKKSNENYLQHPQNFLSCNNSTSNNNNGTSEQIKWDSSLQATHIDQSNIIILLYLNIYLNFYIKYNYCKLIFLNIFKLKIKEQ